MARSRRIRSCVETSVRCFNFKPVATDAEVRASALQYVRKVRGMLAPSRTNHAAFEQAVENVAAVSQRLLASLVTRVPPKSREEERAKARVRWERRAANPKRAVDGLVDRRSRSISRCLTMRA